MGIEGWNPLIASRSWSSRRWLRAVCGPVLLAGTLVLASCGSEGAAGDPPGADEANAVDEVVVPEGGPALLPPLDSPVLAGLDVRMVRSQEDVDPETVEQSRLYAPGQIVLYGDAEADDPFEHPWALAIRYQGAENSELGSLLPDARDLSFIDVPVEQLSQETLSAGVLSSRVSVPQDLADGLVVGGGDSAPGTVEIDPEALRASAERLDLITSGPIDIGQLGNASADPGITPQVEWASPGDASDDRRVSITSYAADPGLELLLRATMGGASVGRQVMPVVWADGEVMSAVRTIDGTTVLVQSLSLSLEQVTQLLTSLQPADQSRFDELTTAYMSQVELPMGVSDAAETARGEALGGVWIVAVDVSRAQGPYGEFDNCEVSSSLLFPDGRFSGGGLGSGICSESGSYETAIDGNLGLTFISGEVPVGITRLVLTFDDGTVQEPLLAGERRQPFGVVVPGLHSVVSAQTYGPDGAPISDLTAY